MVVRFHQGSQIGVRRPPRRRPHMQSSNPVFRRSEGFNGKATASGMTYPAYGTQTQADPYARGRQDAPVYGDTAGGPRMTIDSVVQKTGMTLGLTILVAAATWVDDARDHPQHRRRRRSALPPADGRRLRRLRAVARQLLQAGHQPGLRARLRRPRGPVRRCLQQGDRGPVRRPRRRRSRDRRGRRHVRRGGRHARGVQVLQHPGQPDVPQVGRRRDDRLRRHLAAGRRAAALRRRRSASTASARWAWSRACSAWASAC